MHRTTGSPELVGGSEPLYVKLAHGQPGDRFHPTIILDTAFAPSKVFTSHMGGCVRCFTTLDLPYLRAGELWRYTPSAPKCHVLRLAYRPSDDHLVGSEWAYGDTNAQDTLVTWNIHNGEVVRSVLLSRDDDRDFCLAGRVFIGSDRSVMSTFDGSIVGKLE